jgi:predicted ATPase
VSYDLLSERTQARFLSLAVFPDTFDAEAAAAIWAIALDIAEDSLEKLCAYSLIEFNESSTRYRLHDLVRLFVDSRLVAGDRHSTQCHHVAKHSRWTSMVGSFRRS